MVGQVAAKKAKVSGILEVGIEDYVGLVGQNHWCHVPRGGGARQLLHDKESCGLLESQWGQTEHQEDGIHLVFCWTGNL
jgi:hypothetical protein